jgi:hypothetical protein
LVGLLIAGWAAAQPGQPGARGRGGQPNRGDGLGSGPALVVRTAWEYRTLTPEQVSRLAPEQKDQGQFAGGLNKLGAEGWELVAFVPTPLGRSEFVFKRPAGRLLRSNSGVATEPPQALAGVPVASPQELRVFRLKNATAADMERLLAKLFPGGGRAGGGLRLASDERTNSVLVYGPPTQLDEIEAILTRLDTPEGVMAPGKK